MLLARIPDTPLYRIARGPDPWEYPDWSKGTSNPDGTITFGNRFDDPDGQYRVVYASSEIVGCYVETLARFRPDATLTPELQRIAGEDDFQPLGLIPEKWFENRVIGCAEVRGKFAEIYTGGWVGHLRSRLSPVCEKLGLGEFDLSVPMQARERIVTQQVSGIVHDLANYAGICYASRFGEDMRNWALFEDAWRIDRVWTRPVSPSDPELAEALKILRLDVPHVAHP